ncbi:hypothetical protein M8C21_025054 [Ambrosia artemisiifolia]|uniref:Uncharacterized protein n=1 Tax=Ambrosia artemisiifolia TaxID=4212 RepID=A0AAD5C5R7_AMBAR|nr:hypothetical protein M8C21_025054 [Ambrosia artemisiifolia]
MGCEWLRWVATIVAVVLLVTAVGLSTRQREGKPIDLYHIECDGVKAGIFAIGATLALLSAVFGISAYMALDPPPQTNKNHAVGLSVDAIVDPEKSPQHPPQ